MADWTVVHAVSGQTVEECSTKKAATTAAKEMTEAHEKIGALHNGEPVSFDVVKQEEPAQAPVEDQ